MFLSWRCLRLCGLNINEFRSMVIIWLSADIYLLWKLVFGMVLCIEFGLLYKDERTWLALWIYLFFFFLLSFLIGNR